MSIVEIHFGQKMSTSQFLTQAPLISSLDRESTVRSRIVAARSGKRPLTELIEREQSVETEPESSESIECAPLDCLTNQQTITSSNEEPQSSTSSQGNVEYSISRIIRLSRAGDLRSHPMRFLHHYSRITADQRTILSSPQSWYPTLPGVGAVSDHIPSEILESMKIQADLRAKLSAQTRRSPSPDADVAAAALPDASADESVDWSLSPPEVERFVPPDVCPFNHQPSAFGRAMDLEEAGRSVTQQPVQYEHSSIAVHIDNTEQILVEQACSPEQASMFATPCESADPVTTSSEPLPHDAQLPGRKANINPILVKNTPYSLRSLRQETEDAGQDTPSSTRIPATHYPPPGSADRTSKEDHQQLEITVQHASSKRPVPHDSQSSNGVEFTSQRDVEPSARMHREISPPVSKRQRLMQNENLNPAVDHSDGFTEFDLRRGVKNRQRRQRFIRERSGAVQHEVAATRQEIYQPNHEKSVPRRQTSREASRDSGSIRHSIHPPQQTRQSSHLSTRSAVVLPDSDPLKEAFRRYKDAYPDYEAAFKQFQAAVKTLLTANRTGESVHPFMWDDFIFRRATEYTNYQMTCAGEGEEALLYRQYYEEKVSSPDAVKRVITKEMLHACDISVLQMMAPNSRSSKDVSPSIRPSDGELSDHELTSQGHRYSQGSSEERSPSSMIVDENLAPMHLSTNRNSPLCTPSTTRRRGRLPWTMQDYGSNQLPQQAGAPVVIDLTDEIEEIQPLLRSTSTRSSSSEGVPKFGQSEPMQHLRIIDVLPAEFSTTPVITTKRQRCTVMRKDVRTSRTLKAFTTVYNALPI